MANQFITIKQIARTALPRLIDNLVFPNLIHKDFSEEFARKQGDTIQVRKPVILEAQDFDPTQGTASQDVKEESVEVKLDHIATVDISIEALEGALSFDDVTRLFIEPAAAALAEKINRDGLELYKDVPTYCGTAGTTPSTLAAIANARKQLNLQKVPTAGRVAVWDPEADAAFSTLDAIVHAEKSGTTQALREGSIGRVMGMNHFMSQAVKAHTAGTAQPGTIKVNANASKGADKISLKGLTAAAGKTAKGDIIKIGKYSYVITGEVTASSNVLTDVPISPALQANVAADTAVTYVPSHTANLAFHPMAFAFVNRPLTAPAGVESYVTSYNGVSLRVVRGYDMTHKREVISMDVLYNFKTIYPELACRVLG